MGRDHSLPKLSSRASSGSGLHCSASHALTASVVRSFLRSSSSVSLLLFGVEDPAAEEVDALFRDFARKPSVFDVVVSTGSLGDAADGRRVGTGVEEAERGSGELSCCAGSDSG